MNSSCFVLFVVFLVLKLTGYIAWSWWWITAPLWGGFLVGVAFYIGLMFYIELCGTPKQRFAQRAKLGEK